jgi:two-component SAPR family response regulator
LRSRCARKLVSFMYLYRLSKRMKTKSSKVMRPLINCFKQSTKTHPTKRKRQWSSHSYVDLFAYTKLLPEIHRRNLAAPCLAPIGMM